MKKILLVSKFLLLFIFNLYSQKKSFSIGVGPSIGFAVGNESYNYFFKNAVGGAIQASYGVTKLGSIISTVSYQSIGAKNAPVTKTNFSQFKLGYKTGFLNSGFFLTADAGIAGYQKKLNKLILSTAVGYSFKISPTGNIDIFPSYSIIPVTSFNSMWLSANVLIRFNIPKKK